jgi:hypothetical protein
VRPLQDRDSVVHRVPEQVRQGRDSRSSGFPPTTHRRSSSRTSRR